MSIAAPFFYLQDSLNNNGSISDQSRHARSIRMSGIQEDRDAEFGSCFRISSNAYFEATCPAPASFTLALWVRSLVIEEAPGQTRTLIQLGSHDARLCTKDLKPSFAELALSTQKLDRDVWQHLAVSFDATSQMCIVYLDGARIANTSTTLDTTGDILRIGMGSNTNDLGFEGKIAHVLLYDRALSDDDIQEVMWATEKNIEPVLLLRDTTRLAEKIVKDDSGHGILCNADGVTAVNDAERGLCYELSNGYVAADAQICPSSFTLSAWVKQHDTATETFYPLIEFGEDAPGLQIKNSKLSLIGGASSTVDFPKGVWKHIAVTYNPISQRSVLFVDGIQVGTAIGAIDTTGAGLLIGTGWREEDPLFAGLMAHVAIHDAPLSARDIEDLRAFSAIRAHLHLPLDVKDATGRTPDASSRSAAALCNGPVAVSDNKFGTAIYFDGVDDFIDVSSLNCPVSFTFAAYICPDAIACRREVPILEFGRGEPFFWLSYGRLKVHSGPTVDVDHALTPDTWAHVVATYDAPMHTISLYIDGELVASGDFSGSTGGIGLGVGHRYSANWFRGRMRHVMVYDQAFSKDLIRQIIAHTSPPNSKTPRPLTRPGVGLFSMDLINDAEQPVLYLEQTQQLSLSIENTWGGDIQLVATNNPVGPDCFHFQMQFRQGTLNPTFRDELIAGTGETISNLRTLGWSLHCQDLDTGGDLISLLWTGGSSSTPIAGLIKSKARLVLPLRKIQVKLGSGSRTSRVLMRYDQMRLPDGTAVPRGQRIELLNILAQPRAEAGSIAGVVASFVKEQLTADAKLPVEIKIQSSKTLLNDGGPNKLDFSIKNLRLHDDTAARLELGTSGAIDTTPKFYVQLPNLFDEVDGSTSDNINGVSVVVKSSSTSPRHIWTCTREGSRWCIKPPAEEMFFEPNEILTITLDQLKTNERHGTIYLTVRYEDIANYGEGEFHIPVHIAPLAFARVSDRDTVIIRHGNQVGVDPANEALFVESSEGMAARFVGGGGVAIDSPDPNASALWIRTRPDAAKPAIFVDKSGGSSHGLHVDATSSDAAVFVEQDGKGHGIRVYKTDSPDKTEAGSHGLHVVHNGKVAAARIDKTGAQYGLHVTATSSDAAVFVEQNDKGPGLSINKTNTGKALSVTKEGAGLSAEFLGGDGVVIDKPADGQSGLKITTKPTSTATALYVDQKGTGNAAEFLGGGGLRIDQLKVGSTGLSVTANSNTAAALVVNQTGTGPSAEFTGGSGVTADKLTATTLTSGTITSTGAMQAQSSLTVSGSLAANGGLSVPSGASVSGVSVVEFQTVELTHTQTGSPSAVSGLASFSRSVKSAQVFLQSFNIEFRKADDSGAEEHWLRRMKIEPSCSSPSGSTVTVYVEAGMRDDTGDWNDKYKWTVTVVVIALLDSAR